MERPVKRLKVTRSDSRSPRETGSKMAEGLFTSEMGMSSDDGDGREPTPTRTIALSDLRRHEYREKPQRRQMLPRDNEGVQLRPRAPDATVTATVVDVNVADGTSTVSATEVTIASDATVVSLSDYSGSVTVPGASTATDLATITSNSTNISTDTGATTNTITSSTSINVAESILSAALTGNGTITSTESTVTVTATSTFEISYINGTFIPPRTTTDHVTVTTHTSRTRNHTSEHSMTSNVSQTDISQSLTDSSFASQTDSSLNSGTTYPASNPTTTPAIAPGASNPGSSSTTTAAAPNNSNSGNSGPGLTPTQQQMVGGVIGGVAGVALVLVFLLVLLRWYRRRLKSRGELPEQRELNSRRGLMGSPGDTIDASRGHGMISHSRNSSGIPFAAAAAMVRRWGRPHSGATFATTATATSSAGATTAAEGGSEKGFQRIAGRKIAPVLSSGGDGFGGDYGAFEKDAAAGTTAAAGVGRRSGVATPTDTRRVERKLSRNSFYREKDHGGFYADRERSSSVPGSPRSPLPAGIGMGFPTPPRGLGSSHSQSQARDFASNDEIKRQLPRDMGMGTRSDVDLNARASRPEGFAVMRPSPARTPTTGSVNVSEVRLSMPRGEEGSLGLIDGEGTPPMPLSPIVPIGMGGDGSRGRLMVPGVRGSPAVSRSSGGSRFREGIS